jgi:hypothetical protein
VYALASIGLSRRRHRRDECSPLARLTRYRNIAAELLRSFAHAPQAVRSRLDQVRFVHSRAVVANL